MTPLLLALVAASPLPAGFTAEPGSSAPPSKAAVSTNAPLPLRARLGPDLIKEAVRDTLAEEPDPVGVREPALRADPYREFGRQMSEARVPDCLHQDGLKRQSTFLLRGVLALPFIAVAKLRGKCN